jgi:uncharacterized protein
MPEITKSDPGTFCWIELATSSRREAQQFYTSLFGWNAREVPIGEDEPYVMLEKNGKNVGALYQNTQAPPNWLSYVTVDSADDTAKTARDLGANLIQEPFDVMEHGRMAVVQDPQGAVFALWQPIGHQGVGVRDEANTLCWNELMTTDIEAARKFYGSLFSWQLKVSPGYTEAHVGDQAVGGLMQIAPEMQGMPSNWKPYFMVDDVDATVQKAQSLGVKEMFGPMDIEGVGRFAILNDPQGAAFAVIKLAERAAG